METGYFMQQYRKDARWDWVDFYCGVQFGSTVTFDIGDLGDTVWSCQAIRNSLLSRWPKATYLRSIKTLGY
jgi:hypothetical protein